MKTSMLSDLSNALKELEYIPENICCQNGYEEYVDMQKIPAELAERIASLADTLLITSRGGISYSAIVYLRSEGFPVTPGETDSFGWLSGCIHTAKGIVVFG